MDQPMTSDELRIAAKQAISLAVRMKDEAARSDLLSRAQRLLREAEAGLSAAPSAPERTRLQGPELNR
jgi:hypothetical protein